MQPQRVKSDLVGSYEIVTEGATEILVITVPEEIEDIFRKNRSKLIFSVQDGAVRRGEYIFAEEQYQDNVTESFSLYNEIAAKDIAREVEASKSLFDVAVSVDSMPPMDGPVNDPIGEPTTTDSKDPIAPVAKASQSQSKLPLSPAILNALKTAIQAKEASKKIHHRL